MDTFTFEQLEAMVGLYQFISPQDRSIDYQASIYDAKIVLHQIDDIDNPKVLPMPTHKYHLFSTLVNNAFDKLVKEIGVKELVLNELKTAIKEASTQEETLQQAVRDILSPHHLNQ